MTKKRDLKIDTFETVRPGKSNVQWVSAIHDENDPWFSLQSEPHTTRQASIDDVTRKARKAGVA
ncbi:MAG TPA: hypothetical protein VK698_39335 [Kofleriaceae bacterium]|nr:hypothetical protein [Kofleriaceae bacterium]